MKATVKCDQHCELHDSVNHLKVERILLFLVILEIMFSECHCLCVGVRVLMASRWMSWFVFMLLPFYFSFFCFFVICVSDLSFFHDLIVHFLRFFSHFYVVIFIFRFCVNFP